MPARMPGTFSVRSWAVPATLLGIPVLGVAVGSWPFLRGGAIELLLHGGELLVEEFELHLRVDVTTPQTGYLSLQPGDLLGLSDGGFLEVRGDLLEGRDVGDFLQLRHELCYQ